MWDNRATMHRGRPFDAHEVRDMRRTTLAVRAVHDGAGGVGLIPPPQSHRN